MNLTVRIPDNVAMRLTAAGVDAEQLALAALSHAADELELQGRKGPFEPSHRTPAEAAARMRRSRPGNILPDDTSIRDLITYGRA